MHVAVHTSDLLTLAAATSEGHETDLESWHVPKAVLSTVWRMVSAISRAPPLGHALGVRWWPPLHGWLALTPILPTNSTGELRARLEVRSAIGSPGSRSSRGMRGVTGGPAKTRGMRGVTGGTAKTGA